MKDKMTASLLAIFLGGLGLHKFYLGKTGWGVIYLVFCWTFIPSIVALLEGISYMSYSQERWDKEYNNIVTAQPVQAASAATHKKCPDCAEVVMFEAKKCKHCGCVFAENSVAG